MNNNQNKKLNKLLHNEGSISEQAKLATELNLKHLRIVVPHSKYAEYELNYRIASSQKWLQIIIVILTIILVLSTIIYTFITWQSVCAMREGNEIQQQLLQHQKTISVIKPIANHKGDNKIQSNKTVTNHLETTKIKSLKKQFKSVEKINNTKIKK